MGEVTQEPMWLVYQDATGALHFQPWQDLTESGGLIDPETGDDMAMVGWTTSPART